MKRDPNPKGSTIYNNTQYITKNSHKQMSYSWDIGFRLHGESFVNRFSMCTVCILAYTLLHFAFAFTYENVLKNNVKYKDFAERALCAKHATQTALNPYPERRRLQQRKALTLRTSDDRDTWSRVVLVTTSKM